MSTVKVTITAGDNGSVSPDGEITIAKGSDLVLTATADAHYQVCDWFQFGQNMGIDTACHRINGVSQDTSVHVAFEVIMHEVVTTPQHGAESSGGSLTPCSSTDTGRLRVKDGESLSFTANPSEGHFVVQWLVDGSVVQRGGNHFTLSNIVADRSVVAQFSDSLTTGPLSEVATVGRLSLENDPALASILERTMNKGKPGRVAIADISALAVAPETARVPYAEWPPGCGDLPTQADSIPKIGILVALYRLRAQLRAAVLDIGATNLEELARAAQYYWKDTLRLSFPKARADFPDIKKLFSGTAIDNVDFAAEIKPLIKNMITRSDNQAAGSLVDLLGFQYLNGALRAEGLCDEQGRGIWITLNYARKSWSGAPKGLPRQSATLNSLTAFWVALMRWEVVDEQSSIEMFEFFERAGLDCTYSGAMLEIGKIGFYPGRRYAQTTTWRLPVTISPGAVPTDRNEFTVVSTALLQSSKSSLKNLLIKLNIEMAKRHAAVNPTP